MNSLANIFLSAHVAYATLIIACFFITLVVDDDELHQYAMNRAMKVSVIITILSLMGYCFYKLISGSSTISINVIFFGIEGLSLLTLLLYFLELKGFSFSIKKNKKVGKVLCTLSTVISVLTTLNMIFKFKVFANPTGIINYNELILFINFLILPLIILLFPKNKTLNRYTYKKEQKELNKTFKIFTIIYVICILLFMAYIIYRFA